MACATNEVTVSDLRDQLFAMEARISRYLDSILQEQQASGTRLEALLPPKDAAAPAAGGLEGQPEPSVAWKQSDPPLQPEPQGDPVAPTASVGSEPRTEALVSALPGWPGSIRPRFEQAGTERSGQVSCLVSSTGTMLRDSAFDDEDTVDLFARGGADATSPSILTACRLWQVGDPTSAPHVLFSLCGAIMLLVDMMVSPFVLAWEVPTRGFLWFFACASSCFWLLDICVSFRTGFFRDGALVMRGPEVAGRYLRTWFLPDAILVICEWLSVVAVWFNLTSRASMGLSLIRIVKSGKFMRIIVLVRAFRFLRTLRELAESILSEAHRIAVKVFVLTCLALWVSHVLACLWFVLGRSAPSDTGRRWVDIFEHEQGGWLQEYVYALQWSIATVTLGAPDVDNANTLERIFSTACLMLGLLGSSFFVSSLFATVVEIHMAQKEKSQKMRCLQEYLRSYAVKASISLAVQRQVATRMSERIQLTESSVPALDLVASTLRLRLRFEIVKDHLATHGLFDFLISLDKHWCITSLGPAVEMLHWRLHDDIFLAGVPARAAYCLADGRLSYIQKPEFAPVTNLVETSVEPGAWLAEGALWAEWVHVGQAKARSPCSLIAIQPEKVQESLQTHVRLKRILLAYAQEFHKQLISSHPPSATWPTDLAVPFADWSDLIVSMPRSLQLEASMQAMDRLQISGVFSRTKTAVIRKQLQHDISNGKAVVVLDRLRQAYRLIVVVALRVVREDEHILAQLGKIRDDVLEADCVLPGVRPRPQETVSDAMRRALRARLHPLAEMLDVENIECSTVQDHSGGIPTQYKRRVYHTRLKGDGALDVPTCTLRHPFAQEPAPRASVRPAEQPAPRRQSTFASSSIFSRLGSATYYSASDLEEQMLDRHVLFVRSEGSATGRYYTWLHPSEFEEFSKDSRQDQVWAWLARLGTPPPPENRRGQPSLLAVAGGSESATAA